MAGVVDGAGGGLCWVFGGAMGEGRGLCEGGGGWGELGVGLGCGLGGEDAWGCWVVWWRSTVGGAVWGKGVE